MRVGTFYLNNSGSRWVHYDENGKKEKVKVLFPNGRIEERTILYYESFGNFGSVCVSIKGVKKTHLYSSTRLPNGEEFIGIIL